MARCPNCGNECPPRAQNPYRPFCSGRCKDVDLGHWFEGDYVISRPLLPDGARLPGGPAEPESED